MVNYPRALWVSTSMSTRGGVASFVRSMQGTDLWSDWNIEHIGTHRNGSIPLRVGAFIVGLSAFTCALLRRRPEIVHLHTASYGSFVRKAILARIARTARVPVILHVHGAEFHSFYAGCPAPVRALIRATLTGADAVVALGDRWALRLRQIAPDARITVIPNAVRPKEPVSQLPDGRGVNVLFLGEVGERKGTFVLLDAWARLAREGFVSDAHLTVAGDGAVATAARQVADLGIADTVTIAGWAAPEQVPELLRNSRVLVLPSRNEGQPMAVLEAMASGLCVVAGDVGGIPDLLDGDSGMLVPPDDPDALAAALRTVITDDAERTRLGTGAWRRVCTDFDVDVVSRRFDALYREVGRCPVPCD
ncbi:glycosyltransferase family 4 protein [Rhodococcus sp. NPDC047139]|uniref:glycosyltransferase family 4 protein n=1 Tax=Rhodococcus sp. NPDC047139 TaxID=3155141 RepID=UPI0033D81579